MKSAPRGAVLVAALAAFLAAAAEADVPKAVIVLESFRPAHADQAPEAAPPRFVLLEDGTVFVGGTRELWTAKLPSADVRELERRVEAMRRITPLAGTVSLGEGPERRRLVLRKGRAVDVRVHGAADRPSPTLTLLAELVRDLERFHHPALRPYTPASYALSAREGLLPGGCRPWNRAQKITDAVFAPVVLPAADVEGWPTGANPARVCVDEKSYVVTFRPLLPGETP
jgi:hypothetical protein